MYITHPSTKHGSNRDHKASRTPRTGTGEEREGEEDVYVEIKKIRFVPWVEGEGDLDLRNE